MTKNLFYKTLVAGAAALLMAGCSANGDGSEGATSGGNLNPGGGTGSIFPNDGTVGGQITENGTPLTGHFICTQSANAGQGATTEIGANGLLGSNLTTLLNLLGAGPATTLLNSVISKELTIDGDLLTGSTFTLPAGLLTNAIDSIDQSVLNISVPAGGYAVFGLTFPSGTADLSLINTVVITTFSGATQRETKSFTLTSIDLLGQNLVGDKVGFYGMKVTQAYDRATIELNPVLAPDVGAAMRVHELCTGGNMVP